MLPAVAVQESRLVDTILAYLLGCGTVGLVAAGLEVSRRRLRARAVGLDGMLATERRRAEAVLDSLVEGVLLTDQNGLVTATNRAAEAMLAFGRGEAMGRGLEGLLVFHGLPLELLLPAGRTGAHEADVHIDRPTPRDLHVYSMPLSATHSGLRGTLVVLYDVSKIRHLETVRRDFVANVSHELRTPIASMKAMAETLIAGALEDHTVARRFLGTIDTEADRLARLVDDLLQLSRIEAREAALHRERLPLARLISDTLTQLQAKADTQSQVIRSDVPGDPIVYADEDKLRQVLVNLIDNAITHAGKGSEVTVSAAETSTNGVAGTTILVSDNGVGIPESEQCRVFERFYRVDKARSRRMGGTGLGLSIVKHIVDAHGGTIDLLSEEGKGTLFSVFLPGESRP